MHASAFATTLAPSRRPTSSSRSRAVATTAATGCSLAIPKCARSFSTLSMSVIVCLAIAGSRGIWVWCTGTGFWKHGGATLRRRTTSAAHFWLKIGDGSCRDVRRKRGAHANSDVRDLQTPSCRLSSSLSNSCREQVIEFRNHEAPFIVATLPTVQLY